MTFSITKKHKKDKKIILHLDLNYFYQGNKTCIYTLSVVVQSSKHAASTERDWNKYLHFQQSACLTFTAMARTIMRVYVKKV